MAYQPVPVLFNPVDTLIVPMDSIYQNNGMYKAYGLIFRLLYENIIKANDPNYDPIYVYWAINPSKTSLTTIDFTATTRGYNTALPIGTYQYSGGPFIIQSANLAYVKTLINTWNTNNTPVVTIHELMTSTTINTIAKLIRPPRISVEDNNNSIVRTYLNVAGLPDYYVLAGAYGAAPVWTTNNVSVLEASEINSGAFFGNTSQLQCRKLAYDIFISPHTDEKNWTQSPNTLPNLNQFLQLGGVLHSMCESIVAIENNALFLTTSGIDDPNQGTTFFINSAEATNPLVQAVPTTNPQQLPGGSVQTWQNTLTNYKSLTDVLAYFIRNNIQYDFMIGGPYQGWINDQNAKGAGAIIYEGGHQYTNSIPYTGGQENMYTKFVLNSIFLSVTKPFIELTMNPIAIVADGNPQNISFSIQNISGGQAKNATISVSLLPGMTPSNYSPIPPTTLTPNSPSPGYTSLTWNNITLDGGDAITFDVDYTPSGPGALPINFTATYGDEIFATGQNPYILDACSTLQVLPSNSPFVLIQKLVDGDTQTFIESGDSVVFTYIITNYGDQPAYDIEIVDPILSDYFNFGLIDVTPAPQSIDPINKKIIFQPGLGGLSIPAGPPPVLGNPLIVTVNATHIDVVPPSTIINTAYVEYYNNYPGDPTPDKTSPNSNLATTNIILPDILVEKSVDKANAAIGDILTYTMEITNTGNTIITQVDITDLIPSGTSYVPGSLNVITQNITPAPTISAQYIAAPPQRIEVLVTGELKPIEETPGDFINRIIVEFDVMVNSIVSNPISNYATVEYIYEIGDEYTGAETEDSNTVETNIASLQMVKNAPTFVELGENLTYSISLTNNGKIPLTNVILTDTIPPGTSYVSVTGATFISQVGQVITLQVNSIPVNDTVTVELTVNVNTLPPDPYTIVNSASAVFTVDGNPKSPVTDTATTVVVEGNIDVNKGTLGDISNAQVGDTVTYSIVVTNAGNVPVTLTNLTDVIQQAANTSFQGQFTVGGNLLAPQPANLNNVNLTTAAPLNILDPQESITITYNVGIISLPPGPNPRIDNTVTIGFEYEVGQEIIEGEEQDSYTVNIQTPGISALKEVDKANAAVGDILTYTVDIINTGTINIDRITVIDSIPTGTTYVPNSLNVISNIPITSTVIQITPQIIVQVDGQLKPQKDIITIEFQVTVNSIVSNPITNQGTVEFDYRVDPNGPIITESEDTNIVETNIAALTINKEGPGFVELGENLDYTITLTNNGEVNLTNVKLIDTIPSGTSYVSVSGATFISQVGQVITLQVNSIPVNGTANVDITVLVNTLPPQPYTIINTASAIITVNGEEKPPVIDKVTTVVVNGNISVNKGTVGNINYAKVGDTVTYEITVTNTGNVPVTLTTLQDVIQQIGYTNPQITNKLLGIVLVPNQSTTITYDVDITDLPPGKKIDNIVTVTFNYLVGQELQTGQVKDDFTLNVEEINVNLTKSVNKTFAEPGEELTYTFKINNDSSVPITNVYLFDSLPANTTFIPGSFTLNPTQNPTIFPGAFIGNIPSNTSVASSFRVRVNPNLNSAVNIPDSGSVTYNYKLNQNEPGPGQPAGPVNSNTVNTKVEIPKIQITKSVSNEYAEVGDIVTYTITVQNTGTVNAYDVEVIDILPPQLQFIPGTLVVTPQQQGDTVSGTDPSYVKINIIRANPNVVTIQFNVEVITRPQSGKIDNIANANFKYSLDPTKPPTLSKTNIPSNIITITVQEIDVEILKSANKTFVEVGQNVTYTIQITNKSTVPVDIKFTDTLPSETQYVTGSFNLVSGSATVTNNTAPNSTLIDIDITGMAPQSSIIFRYTVKVLSLPLSSTSQEITNAAVAIPEYSLFPGGPIREGDPVSDEVTTSVIIAKLDIIKSVDKTIATIGDILHYTIIIINNGNVTAQNVVFSDNVPDGTEFVEGSLTVNDVPVDFIPEEGVDIEDISPGEIVTVEFDVEVVSIPEPPNEQKAENTALVTFEVELDGELQPRPPVPSNPVETELVNVELEVIKTVDKEIANVGDTLTYKVVITNTGDVTIDNAMLSDVIPQGTVLAGSQPVQNVSLGSIEPGESITITFQVKIISKPCPPKLINKATITGSYTVETQRRIEVESNEVVTYVGVSIFKQLSVDTNVKIPPQKPAAEDIIENIAYVEITYTYLIKTPIVTSYEGQELTGWKLIVEGIIRQKVVYIANEPTQSVHAAEFEIPFSTFVILPKDFKQCSDVRVTGYVEDDFAKLLSDRRTIFKNITLMIEGRVGC